MAEDYIGIEVIDFTKVGNKILNISTDTSVFYAKKSGINSDSHRLILA